MQPKTRLRQLIIVATASMSVSGLFSQNALAETKLKPDLPLDEEIYEPSPAKSRQKPDKKIRTKQEHTASQSQKSAQSHKTVHQTDEVQSIDETPAGEQNLVTTPHEPKSPHVPEQQAPTVGSPEMLEEEYHESTPTNGSHENSNSKPSLLEGKVQPTPAAKGSGMVWFVAIFVLLAAAIFIFT